MTVPMAALDPRLVQVYGVDETMLDANRRGRMTPAQANRLRAVRKQIVQRYVLRAALVLVVFVVLQAIPGQGLGDVLLLPLRAAVLLTFMVQVVQAFMFFRQTERELADKRVVQFPGRLHKWQHSRWRIIYCERGSFHHFTAAEWAAFDHQGRYRVYCTPRTRLILAAQSVPLSEPIPEAWARKDDPT